MNGTDDILALFFNNSNLPFDFKDINKKNLDDTIYLTENGFSEPVGIYDCQTRTAKLTKSIINKSLVIDIDNVTASVKAKTFNFIIYSPLYIVKFPI